MYTPIYISVNYFTLPSLTLDRSYCALLQKCLCLSVSSCICVQFSVSICLFLCMYLFRFVGIFVPVCVLVSVPFHSLFFVRRSHTSRHSGQQSSTGQYVCRHSAGLQTFNPSIAQPHQSRRRPSFPLVNSPLAIILAIVVEHPSSLLPTSILDSCNFNSLEPHPPPLHHRSASSTISTILTHGPRLDKRVPATVSYYF